MKFRPLIIRREDGKKIKFEIENIKEVIDEFDRIIIIFKNGNRTILSLKDYFYPRWQSFRDNIHLIFEEE